MVCTEVLELVHPRRAEIQNDEEQATFWGGVGLSWLSYGT